MHTYGYINMHTKPACSPCQFLFTSFSLFSLTFPIIYYVQVNMCVWWLRFAQIIYLLLFIHKKDFYHSQMESES